MKIMMVKSAAGISREDGAATQRFIAGQEYTATEAWEKKVLAGFVKSGFANEIAGNAEVPETKMMKRARAKTGQLLSDDPNTPNVNEAWEGGKAPRKKTSKKSK